MDKQQRPNERLEKASAASSASCVPDVVDTNATKPTTPPTVPSVTQQAEGPRLSCEESCHQDRWAAQYQERPAADVPTQVALDVAREDELWIFYKPFLSSKVMVVFLAALLLVWSFGWMYIGATWDPLARTGDLEVWVINCDAGISGAQVAALPAALQPLGQQLQQQPLATSLLQASVFNASSPVRGLLGWTEFSCAGGCATPAAEASCYQEAMDGVNNGDPWAVFFFRSDTSSNFLGWFSGAAGAAINPRRVSLEYIYGRGRSYTTYSFVNLQLAGIASGMSQALGLQVASSPALFSAIHPLFLLQPLQLVYTDLHPVAFFGQNTASYIFCILIWLGSSFSAAVSSQFKMPAEIHALNTTGDKRPARLLILRAMVLKALACLLFLFILVVLLNCILYACGQGQEGFQLDGGMSIAFGWYLSWSFLSMNAMLLHMLGAERFSSMSAFLLILQLMSSGGIVSEELSNPFFRIGLGLPFYYGVRGFRTIFFGGLENLMPANWLVLTAWNVLSGILATFFITHRVHLSGEKARPQYIPMAVLGDSALLGI